MSTAQRRALSYDASPYRWRNRFAACAELYLDHYTCEVQACGRFGERQGRQRDRAVRMGYDESD